MKHGHVWGKGPTWGCSPTYSSWKSMKARCYQPSCPSFERYGGKGIVVCERWHTFTNFLADMGERPDLLHSLDRIDNNGNYEPGNCRWATEAEQQRNRNNNRFLTYDGKTLCVTDWAAELGLDPRRLFSRLANGMPLDQVLRAGKQSRWKKLEHAGVSLTIAEWSARLGMSRNTLARKLKRVTLAQLAGG